MNGKRRRFQCWRMSLSANRIPFRRNMRWVSAQQPSNPAGKPLKAILADRRHADLFDSLWLFKCPSSSQGVSRNPSGDFPQDNPPVHVSQRDRKSVYTLLGRDRRNFIRQRLQVDWPVVKPDKAVIV